MTTTRPISLGAASGPRQRPRSSWLLRLLFSLLFVLLAAEGLVVAMLVGYAALLVRDGRAPQATLRQAPHPAETGPIAADAPPANPLEDAGLDVWDAHGPVNIILLGLDNDTCDSPDDPYQRSDTMILVRVDPRSARAAMLTLPRDLFVHVDGYGGKKLAMAHYLGDLGGYEPDGGPGLVKQVVRENLEIPVHRYARIDFQGFQRIIDAVGPLTIDVPAHPDDPSLGLRDPYFPDGSCGMITVEFPPGRQEMSGEEALQYARSRKTTSDFDRSRRQMQVLSALRERGTSLGVLLDLPELMPALKDAVDTDLTTTEIIALARVARRMDSDDVVRLALDENFVYDDELVVSSVRQMILRHYPGPWSVLRQHFMDIQPIIEPTQEPPATPSGTPQVTP